MQIRKGKEAKWRELKGEVNLPYEQRCFPCGWNHLSLQFGGGGMTVTCITLGLESGNSNFRKQSFLLHPGEDRSTKVPAARAPGHLATYPPLGSMGKVKPIQRSAERLHKHLQIRTWTYCPRQFLYEGHEG